MCLAPHVHFITLIMVYIFIKMHLTSTMAYILIQMHLAPCVPFETMAMVYVFIKTCLALIMVYIFIKTCFALVVAYVPFKMCLAPTMVNIFIKMHLAHNSIFDVFYETYTKIHYVLQIMKSLFHYNLMQLANINHKLANNSHYLCNIIPFTYHCIHEISNNILKWDNLHYFQVYITLWTHIFQKLAIGHKGSSY
jgi:hypothetical protein